MGDGPGALAERENFSSDYTGTLSLTAIPPAPSITDGASPRPDVGQWYVDL